MRILGIDPGLARVGYGLILTEPVVQALDFGVITTPSDQTLAQRLVMLYGDVNMLLDQCQPDQVIIEKLFFLPYGQYDHRGPGQRRDPFISGAMGRPSN